MQLDCVQVSADQVAGRLWAARTEGLTSVPRVARNEMGAGPLLLRAEGASLCWRSKSCFVVQNAVFVVSSSGEGPAPTRPADGLPAVFSLGVVGPPGTRVRALT